MGKEIELKYKVSKRLDTFNQVYEIEQDYFNPTGKIELLKSLFKDIDMNNINTFRARKITVDNSSTYIVTLKSKSTGYSRDEFEIEVDENIYNILRENIDSTIIKKRYINIIDNYRFEFDEYINLKVKLITLEVELESELDIDNDIKKIENILIENNISFENVTFDERYKNSNLIKYFG